MRACRNLFEDLVFSRLLSKAIVELHLKARSCLHILFSQFFAGILARNRPLKHLCVRDAAISQIEVDRHLHKANS